MAEDCQQVFESFYFQEEASLEFYPETLNQPLNQKIKPAGNLRCPPGDPRFLLLAI
jgi:hypothetical protein